LFQASAWPELSELLWHFTGLPIAISHLAGSIHSTRMTLREVVELFRQEKYIGLWPTEKNASTNFYSQRLGMVWDIALHELNDTERKLLDIFPLLSPDAIQE
jgi:hypothetical protein